MKATVGSVVEVLAAGKWIRATVDRSGVVAHVSDPTLATFGWPACLRQDEDDLGLPWRFPPEVS